MSNRFNYKFVIFILFLFISVSAQMTKKNVSPHRIYGLTIENLDKLDIDKFASQFDVAGPVTLRIVFQKNSLPSAYIGQLEKLRQPAYKAKFNLMGLLFDSSAMKEYHLGPNIAKINCNDIKQVDASYNSRNKCFVENLDKYMDAWEVGNEVNGEWAQDTQNHPSTKYENTIKKIDLTIASVPKTKPIALTVYYSTEADQGDNEMSSWKEHLNELNNKNEIDYVLVSYYEDSSNYHLLTDPDLNSIFISLRTVFGDQFLGMGEFGYSSGDSKSPSKNCSDECYCSKKEQRCDEESIKNGTGRKQTCRKSKTSQMQRYYNLHPSDRLYIGGGFWWNMSDDYSGPKFTAAVNAQFKCLSGALPCVTTTPIVCP